MHLSLEDLNLPVLAEIARLAAPHTLYLVGGFVRDHLLGRPCPDIDLVVSGEIPPLLNRWKQALGGHFITLDEGFGIYRYWVEGLSFDVARMQGSILEDLTRRDLTINALGAGPLGSAPLEILDPTGGLADLAARKIRVYKKENILDDPLRLLRIFRFAATLGFEVEPLTLEWVRECAELITRPAMERVTVELYKLLSVSASPVLKQMDQAGLLAPLFPELEALKQIPPNQHHHLDAFAHSLESVRRLEGLIEKPDWLGEHQEAVLGYLQEPLTKEHARGPWLKLAGLLHDIGKGPTYRIEDGRPRFIGHDQTGAKMATEIANRMRLSGSEREFIEGGIKHHMRPGLLSNREFSKRSIYRFFRDTGDSAIAVLLLSYADRLSAQGPVITPEDNQRHLEGLCLMLDAYYEPAGFIPPRLVDGKQLMDALGLKPGPKVGDLLEGITEAQILGLVHTPEEALAWAKAQIGQ